MKHLINIYFFFVIINFSQTSFAKIENKIILKVENKIVTAFEVKSKILSSLIISGKEINQNNIEDLKAQALESLIQLKLKEIELAKFNIKKNTKQINQYLNSISSDNIPMLKNKFIANNLDYKLFLNEIEIQFKWQKLIYTIYANKIEINNNLDNEINDLIKNNTKIKEYDVSEIEILLENNKSAESKILNIQNEIRNNGFDMTAQNYSIASSAANKGNIGWIDINILTKRISNILSKMEVGDISVPIMRQDSVLFLKINNLKIVEPDNLNKDELKEKLIEQKKNELFNLYSRSHLSKLKNTSLIEYK